MGIVLLETLVIRLVLSVLGAEHRQEEARRDKERRRGQHKPKKLKNLKFEEMREIEFA